MRRLRSVSELEQWRQSLRAARDSYDRWIVVSGGTCGETHGSREVLQAVRSELAKRGGEKNIGVRSTGCLGYCEYEPLVVILPDGIFYPRVSPASVPAIVDGLLGGEEIQVEERLLYREPSTGEVIARMSDLPFYRHQLPILFGKNAELDPTSIEDYVASGGYRALATVIESMSPDEVIDAVVKSGLRGRGGAGFPTGEKWLSVRRARNETKYVICNADEGDPGAYANRGLLEGNPHSVLEGMIIGAYAMGATEGYVYVRDEYPMAVELISHAIQEATECGLIGPNILGTGLGFDIKMFQFKVRVNRGGGAFVCGESSALMASIEGRAGEPRPKHVHMAESGLWGRPTCLNNVETWANVPLIIEKGADWYRSVGTETSTGTKIFSLVGKIANTGLVEVPLGTPLRTIVEDIGGGIRGGGTLKAVQTGGPSGGCVPASLIDTPVDFDELKKIGSMMGSGGIVVLDDRTCIVDVARYFLAFLREESCGKCVPCREGLVQMYHIVDRIISGDGTMEDLQTLEDLGEVMSVASLCQLGGNAANPVLSTLRFFREEYEEHVRDKYCRAGVCRNLRKPLEKVRV